MSGLERIGNMQNPTENKNIMSAINDYISDNDLHLDGNAVYEWGIDCVGVFVDGNVVLSVGLPPVSNYRIRETEHTNRYLRGRKTVAV